MINAYSTYRDYLKETADKTNSKINNKLTRHIDKCSTAIFRASREGKYSYTYKLPWYYLFYKNRHHVYMAIHNYFKYTMNIKVVITTYKGEIQSLEFSWN